MVKKDSADIEAAEHLNLQLELGDESARRAAHFALTVSLSLFIFIFGILIWALPRKSFSENENRFLANLPTFDIDRFGEQISSFCSDHFPLRDRFVSLAAYTQLMLGRREANNIAVASDGTLAERRDIALDDLRDLENNYIAIARLKELIGKPTTVAVLPDALSAQSELFGLASARELARKDDVIYLDRPSDERIYYKTDHHRTTAGSYIAYLSLADHLGYSALPESDFRREIASNSFYGTAWSRSGLYLTPSESIELWRYDGDSSYNISGDYSQAGFYDMSKLSKKDKYAVFLGGNHGQLEISTDGESKPRLLIIKDSFANSLIPFLARHFDLTVIDPRYFHGELISLAEACDQVLFYYGENSLITDRDLVRLTLDAE